MRTLLTTALAGLVLAAAAAPSFAARITYACTLSGASETFTGEKQRFTGQGSLTVDDATGAVTYSFRLSDGFTISGSGGGAMTPKGRFLGSISTETDGVRGTGVIEGRTARSGSRLDVAITAAVPHRLGAGPEGFVLTKIRVKGARQP